MTSKQYIIPKSSQFSDSSAKFFLQLDKERDRVTETRGPTGIFAREVDPDLDPESDPDSHETHSGSSEAVSVIS